MSAVFTVYSEMSHGLLVEEAMRLRAENAKLRACLEDCAHDLECEINANFPESVRVYPVMQAKYEREMSTVYEARKTLATQSQEPPR